MGSQAAAYAPVYYPGHGHAVRRDDDLAWNRGRAQWRRLPAAARSDGESPGLRRVAGRHLPSNIQLSLAGHRTWRHAGSNLSQARRSSTRVDGSGQFTFRDITPGQYTLQARAVVRRTDTAEAARGAGPGRGGLGPVPPNQIAQVLWASTDVAVNGQDISDIQLVLQPGMTVAGRVEFRGDGAPPTDMSGVRLSLSPRPQQNIGPGADASRDRWTSSAGSRSPASRRAATRSRATPTRADAVARGRGAGSNTSLDTQSVD